MGIGAMFGPLGTIAEFALPFLGDLFGASSARRAQEKANAFNLKLQQQQQAWEAEMSNTAVQRRVQDITKAGGNPALAFTGGQSASTPSVSPATVEPEFRAEWLKGSAAQALMTRAQLQNTQANTALTSQKARQEKVVADYMTEPTDTVGGTRGKFDLQTKTLRSSLAAETERYRKDMTAAQLKQFNEATEAVVQIARQQAERGKIDLDAIKDVVEQFGLGAQQKANLLQTIMKLIIPMMKD